jgi:hypothetical protein
MTHRMTHRIAVAIALLGASAFRSPVVAQGAPTTAERPASTRAPAFERVIRAWQGANRLPVDLPLLLGASPLQPVTAGSAQLRAGLGDLRIQDPATGREIPYLFVWPSRDPAAVWQGARVVPVTPGKDSSGFEADLGRVITVDRLELTRLPGRFLKRVRLEGSGDRVRWTMLVPEGTLYNLPADERPGDVALRQTQLAFATGDYRYLRVIWDDHAGGRLPADVGATARVAPRGAVAADTVRAELTVDRRPSAPRTSRYHLTLPASRLPIVALELDVHDKLVLRTARVTEPRLGADRLAPVPLGAATLRRVTDGDAVAASLTIPIERPSGRELDLVVDDGDNHPLDLRRVVAVMGPLPYIFFSSEGRAPLRATYGGDRRTSYLPPRYDLEALRDSVEHLRTAEASWDAPRALEPPAAASTAPAGLLAAPGAPLDVKTFAFARSIPEGSGLTAIRLDSAALAHSRIVDVRVVDGAGRQVPYVLETLEEPTEIALPAPSPTKPRDNIDRRRVADAAKRSWYRIALPYAGLPDATLRLTTTSRVFSRDVAVVTQDLPRDAEAEPWAARTISAAWSHDDPESSATPLELSLGSRLPSDSVFVLIDDGDNQTLPLTAATLLLPSYRIRFFRQPGAPLTLLYGRRDLGAPSYDLALLTPRLLDAPAQEVAAGAESGGARAPARTARLVFWSVLGLAVVVLLLLIGRLVRGDSPAHASDAAT